MWTVQQLFGVPFEEARLFISGISIAHIFLQCLTIILMFCFKTYDFYMEYYENISQNDRKQQAKIYQSIFGIFFCFNAIALVFTLTFMHIKKNWSLLWWIICHGFLVFAYLIGIICFVTFIGSKYTLAPSSIVTMLSSTALSNSSFFFLWYAVFYHYWEINKPEYIKRGQPSN